MWDADSLWWQSDILGEDRTLECSWRGVEKAVILESRQKQGFSEGA